MSASDSINISNNPLKEESIDKLSSFLFKDGVLQLALEKTQGLKSRRKFREGLRLVSEREERVNIDFAFCSELIVLFDGERRPCSFSELVLEGGFVELLIETSDLCL